MLPGPVRGLLGVPALAAIVVAVGWLAVPAIETELRHGAESATSGVVGSGPVAVAVRGRDVAVKVERPLGIVARRELERALGRVAGSRRTSIEEGAGDDDRGSRVSLRLAEGRLGLTGRVPAGQAHERVARAAALLGAVVDDRVGAGEGAAPGFIEAVEQTIAVLGRLRRGDAVVSADRVDLRGEASDFASYNAAIRGLASLPDGMRTGLVDIEPPEAHPYRWSVSRDDRDLVLDGFVPSEAVRAALISTIRAAFPLIPLADRMQTARGAPRDVDVLALARQLVPILTRLTRGEASVQDDRLFFAGSGPSRERLDAIGRELADRLPRGLVLGSVSLSAIPAQPYVFAVRRTGNRVSLSGYAPAAPERAALLALATRRFPDSAVSDEVDLASGAAEGFASAASLAIEVAADLADGEARLSDRSLAVSGRALYPGLAARTRERASGGVPRGWTAEADIRVDPIEKPLDAGLCSDLIGDVLRRDPVRFEDGRAELKAASQPVLDAAADLVRRCGPKRIRVEFVAAGADGEAAAPLARDRAAAIAAAFARKGGSAEITSTASVGSPAGSGDRVTVTVDP